MERFFFTLPLQFQVTGVAGPLCALRSFNWSHSALLIFKWVVFVESLELFCQQICHVVYQFL